MVAEDEILQGALLQHEEAIFTSGFSNLDQNIDQVSVDILGNAINDLVFSIKSNPEELGRIHRPTQLTHRLNLNRNRKTICVSKNINVGYVSCKRRCDNPAPTELSNDQMLSDLACKFLADILRHHSLQFHLFPNIPRGSGGVKPPVASQRQSPCGLREPAQPRVPPSPLRGGGPGWGAAESK